MNGTPTNFFNSNKHLRHGFPLSPLFLILVNEGINRLINSSKQDKLFQGIKISQALSITHMLFVDDVLMLGKG